MSKSNPIIVGLDIGTTKVVAIAGRKNEFGKLEVLAFGKAESQGVTHGVVLNIDECVASIRNALDNCLKSNPNLDIREVYVGIAGQHIKSLQTRGDRVRVNPDETISKADIEMLIRDQYKTYIPAGDQIIGIIPQEYTVDTNTNIINPVGMSGAKIGANFHIVTGDRNAIKNIKRCVDLSGLKTVDLVLQPLASAAAVMSPEDLEAGVAIVDIGGGTTDMAVFYDGILQHTAVIPYAGSNITNDIRIGLGVLRTQAEAMKTQFGMAIADEANNNAYITIPGLKGLPPKEISVRNLANIIQCRMEEIFDYVMYHLKQLNLDKKLHGGIILTGGGSQLQHILQLAEFKTGLNARLGKPNEHLSGPNAEKLMNPMYSTAVGLILRGYSDFENGSLRTAINKLENETAARAKEVAEATSGIKEYPSLFEESKEDTRVSEEEKAESEKSSKKKNETVKKILGSLKNSFMKMFEETEDEKLS